MSAHPANWATAVLVTLALAGCTTSPPDVSPPVQPGPDSATPAEGPSPQDRPGFEDGPLRGYWMLTTGTGLPPNATEQERQRLLAQQSNEMEKLIAACMAKEGFEYQPQLRDEAAAPDPAEQGSDPDDRGWVSRYGYGLADYPGRTPPHQEEPRDDARRTYLDSLTPAEREAYREAFRGDPQLVDDEEYDWRRYGCYGAAEHQVRGYQPYRDAENQPIMDAMDSFYFELDSQPGFAALHTEWAGCMAEQDYPGFRTQPEAQQSIEELLRGYYPADDGSSDEDPRLKDPSFGTPDDPIYAEIARQEVALALVDLDCRQQADYQARHLRIQFDLEQRFVDDHQEELTALKARAEQGS
ncbi:MAG: hypothetical protein QM804_06400 [Propionicimonas sp.]